ncbi:RHS repeat-associated core domain-containing protein [Pantoea sp. Tr-811]|uniref:RHS repeat-associated core domain-containing protein n=1 Tax=Pantoea sp. Tr-811 TaxID=2608361 RepID=UPI00141F505B|nr:RHS repeat-associated core domain-containing protein [Pantoea sp. Tr-811]
MDISLKGNVDGSRLLAVEKHGSVLSVLVASQPNPLAYSPYGHRHPASGLLSLCSFNAEYQDPVTGHYLLGTGYHRAFNPVLMRFNSPDSWSPFGDGGINCYGYLAGNPVNATDPSGHVKAVPFTGKGRLLGKNTLYFETLEAGKKFGNLDLHGDNELALFDGRVLDGKALKIALTQKSVELSDLDSFRIISCHSADGDNPLARQFAEASKLPTIGFRGRVSPTDGRFKRPNRGSDVVDISDYSIATKNPYKKHHPEYPHFAYSPQIFEPTPPVNRLPQKKKDVRR